MAAARNQPTYDFLTGASSPPPRPPSANRSAHPPPSLRTLQYELDSLKQDRDLTALQHQKELRDVQTKAEADSRRAQLAETSSHAAVAKYDALARELQETQDRCANERLELERRGRTLQEENRALREEVEDVRSELLAKERGCKRRVEELETRHTALLTSLEAMREDLEGKVEALSETQQRLSQREAENAQLESEVLRLRAQDGESETLAVIKRQLSEQVAHIKKLEAMNREQVAELKQYRKTQKSIEVVEEEKRVLESRVRMMDDLRKQLSEAQLQRQILEDERKSWTTYLQTESSAEEELHFESPEDLARAFIRERLETASLLERLGALQPELSVKDDNIQALEDEIAKLHAEIEKLRSIGGGADSKVRARLERQRTLAVKEVEYLREQLKIFDAEESEFKPESFDEQKSVRIRELEEIVDAYRKEVQTLQSELFTAEELAKHQQDPSITGSKRRRDSDSDTNERLGELRRKNRQLQDTISALQTRNALLDKELAALHSQLSSLKSASRTRILELRSNPTADAEALKTSTLNALREENRALLAQLENRHTSENVATPLVPAATLTVLRNELDAMTLEVASKEKRMLRLKQIWSAKSAEFREAVASILGYKMDFMPNGRVRVTSVFYPGEEEGENSIVFDGENGTMKSEFAGEIRELIEFWVEGRKDIPCFLAAMTLEFYERFTRAPKG
ncbi:coiled-coil domain-containing protein mad1 [Coniosporium tulheliwenetii]|uniref:Coiled-coil domain-containing protein mad1 n=1 Tax=Coniosporium tulheliwenetii TaxID=3383036 RepID=A0ACC2ZN66_9PEZI|nr:coiled-coil domain-containing protein mad1 [Cladosporium sp. JES 115]